MLRRPDTCRASDSKMLIGLLSDSHANAQRLNDAVTHLVELGAEVLVHCGDIIRRDHVAILARAGAAAYLVAGNMDRHVGRLAEEARKCGVTFSRDFIDVPLTDGQHLIATHGHNGRMLAEFVAGGEFPYVCHGHTHRAEDRTDGQVRVICPGALSHPRHPKHPTAAVLDTETDTLRFLEV